MKTIKKIATYTVIIGIAIAALYAGNMYLASKNTVTYTAERGTSTPEVIIKGEFEESVRKYKESPEGKEVLNTWATQKAIEEQRAKLDAVEAQMLSKEASL